ncbi:MAG: CoA transferase [Pseudomonadota bacterium]
MSASNGSDALQGVVVRERMGAGSHPTGQVAVAFAGMLAARFGARVLRETLNSADPLEKFPPLLPGGESALHRFLMPGKEAVAASAPSPAGSWLLTDDESAFNAWPDERKVLVRSNFTDPARARSDLTAMAAAGLLDILGEFGRAPLPFPGYQVAYATGMAAFLGMLTNVYTQADGREAARAEAASLEVASWLNWKNRIPAVSGGRQTGLDRPEEWRGVRCRDGYVVVIYRDRDIANIAKLVDDTRLLEPRFATASQRIQHLPEFYEIVSANFANRAKDEILEAAKPLNLQFAAVLAPREVFEDKQMVFRKFFPSQDGVPRLPQLRRAAP